jgi:hypothetical protein
LAHPTKIKSCRHGALGAVVTLALALGSVVAVAAPASAQSDVTVDAVPPVSRVVEGAFTDQPATDGDAPQPKGEPISRAEASAVALARAVKNDDRSYWEPSDAEAAAASDISEEGAAVEAGLPSGALGNRARPALSSSPPDSETDACLSRSHAATADGEVYNRFIWCQSYEIAAKYSAVTPEGKKFQGYNILNYTAVMLGTDTSRRMRLFLRGDSVRYNWPGYGLGNAPEKGRNESLLIDAGCADNTCFSEGPEVQQTWKKWEFDHSWHHWDIRSDELAPTAINPDGVRDHTVFFEWDGTGPNYVHDGKKGPFRIADKIIRCDSAAYFTGADKTTPLPHACVHEEVVPHLTYSTKPGDKTVQEIARHIKDVQDNPNGTYPPEDHPKLIPGKYTGSSNAPGLHRIDDKSEGAVLNRSTKDAACRNTGWYEPPKPLIPAYAGTATKLDCDEYPFASTEEGAGNPHWDFSAKKASQQENGRAGAYLLYFYNDDRILKDEFDKFYVQIDDPKPFKLRDIFDDSIQVGPDTKCGCAWGEPHLVTLDGLAYDFHAAGEFEFAQSDRYRMDIQTRFAPNRLWSYLDRAAVLVKSHVVEFGRDGTILVDSIPKAIAPQHRFELGNELFRVTVRGSV